MTADLAPHEQVAQLFMEHKGYAGAVPRDIEKLDGWPCWYFTYQLNEGILELEVNWNGRDWETLVTTFTLAQ